MHTSKQNVIAFVFVVGWDFFFCIFFVAVVVVVVGVFFLSIFSIFRWIRLRQYYRKGFRITWYARYGMSHLIRGANNLLYFYISSEACSMACTRGSRDGMIWFITHFENWRNAVAFTFILSFYFILFYFQLLLLTGYCVLHPVHSRSFFVYRICPIVPSLSRLVPSFYIYKCCSLQILREMPPVENGERVSSHNVASVQLILEEDTLRKITRLSGLLKWKLLTRQTIISFYGIAWPSERLLWLTLGKGWEQWRWTPKRKIHFCFKNLVNKRWLCWTFSKQTDLQEISGEDDAMDAK